MHKKLVMAMAIVAVLVLSLAGSAFADPALTISASPTTVTWPHGSTLTVTFPTSPATATVLAMPVGASTWTTVSVTVTSTLRVQPRWSTAYKAVVDGVESNVTTVSVAARLSKPILPSVFWHGRSVTVKGTMSPREHGGMVTLQYYKLQTTLRYLGKGRYRKITTWNAYGDPATVALRDKNSATSTWTTKVKIADKGTYKLVVSHQDDLYVLSSATAFFRVR